MLLDQNATIQQIAIANQMQKLEGELAAMRHKVKGKIKNLIESNQTCPFYELLLDYLEGERKLVDITATTFKKIRNKQLTPEQWQLVYDTLQFIAMYLLKTTQEKLMNVNNVQTQNLIFSDNKKVADLTELIVLIKKEKKICSDSSILENLDFAFEEGWTQNKLKEVWNRREKLEFEPNKLSIFITGSAPVNSAEVSKSQRSTTVTSNNQASAKGRRTGFFNKLPPWDKVQEAKHCQPSRNQKSGELTIPGTKIIIDEKYCINQQIWNSCALKSSCKKKKVCCWCGSAAHGAKGCSKYKFSDYILEKYKSH